ncbi:MAG: hypothetical protein HY700_06975 [Gemmatimonadetes bacterium]|nr:hypothetical protein [Gemmatimonadota bacterium]
MPKVQIQADLSEELFQRYEGEAGRSGVPVQSLVEETVKILLREMERHEAEGDDEPILV